MRVTADRNRCCSTAMCVSIAPSHFGIDPGDGRVAVLDAGPVDGIDDVEEAVESCPVSALRLE